MLDKHGLSISIEAANVEMPSPASKFRPTSDSQGEPKINVASLARSSPNLSTYRVRIHSTSITTIASCIHMPYRGTLGSLGTYYTAQRWTIQSKVSELKSIIKTAFCIGPYRNRRYPTFPESMKGPTLSRPAILPRHTAGTCIDPIEPPMDPSLCLLRICSTRPCGAPRHRLQL